MVDVFITVDTEVWCGGWDRLDERFPDAFRKYVYGPTARGDYGLPMKLKILGDHGLRGTFLVEPLFACRFGTAPLTEIVGLILEAGHEVQLHLHTEWVDEALTPILADPPTSKRQFLRDFTGPEQAELIGHGARLLQDAGAESPIVFRAGGYGLNHATFSALQANGIPIDTSYNAGADIGTADVQAPESPLNRPAQISGIMEYPVTVFRAGVSGALRHFQLTACSVSEMVAVLERAADENWASVVIVSHNFELLTPGKTRPDPIALSRFRALCAFLERHDETFRVRGFDAIEPTAGKPHAQVRQVPAQATMRRYGEQALRRVLWS